MKKLIFFILFISYTTYAQNSAETNLLGAAPIIRSTGFGSVPQISGFTSKTSILGHTGTTSTTSNTIGVLGYSENSSAFNYGVFGYANGAVSTDNVGVNGVASVSNGNGYGIKGFTNSGSASADFLYGGHLIATNTPGINGGAISYGLYSQSGGTGTITTSNGVAAFSVGTTTLNSIGVYGESNSAGTATETGGTFIARGLSTGTTKTGVSAKASGTTATNFRYGLNAVAEGPSTINSFGVNALADNSGDATTYGGYFEAKGTGIGTKYGIFAKASGNGTGYAGWFDGKVSIGSSTAPFQLGVTSGTNTSISSTGLVGIGASNTLHLTFDGDDIDAWDNTAGSTLYLNYNSQSEVQIGRTFGSNVLTVAGEIRRPQTSDANLVPIAYGTISSNGAFAITASTNNFTSTKTAPGTYEITITGESYSTGSYLAITTLVSSSFGFIRVAGLNGKLMIYTADTTGTLTDTSFSFAVYKK